MLKRPLRVILRPHGVIFESGRCTIQLVCDHVRIQKFPEGNLVTRQIYRGISEAHCSLVYFAARCRMYRDVTTAILLWCGGNVGPDRVGQNGI
jgi:hypothetical protein